MQSILINMNVVSFNAQHHCCEACRHRLDIHQPNIADPERMLGICRACGSWYVIHLIENDRAIQMAIPGPARTT